LLQGSIKWFDVIAKLENEDKDVIEVLKQNLEILEWKKVSRSETFYSTKITEVSFYLHASGVICQFVRLGSKA